MKIFENNYLNESLKTLKKWISIDSTKSQPEDDAPFGLGVKTMLKTALNDAKNLGFEVKNYSGYIGEVVFGNGSDKDGLAILCHLDVVPAGDISKWNYAPFDLTVKDNIIYGRGVVDDKGCAVLCLYALKQLKDEGFIPSRKIKLIFGCDEESGWGCIEHYNKVATMPSEGFSPDGDFPVIYAEKGILHLEYEFDKHAEISSIFGGDRVNMVCDNVVVSLKNYDKILKESATFYGGIENNKAYCFKGTTAHGSTPEKGDNAIKKALAFLSENNLFNKQAYLNLFCNEADFLKFKDETGILTFSPNVISTNDKIFVKVDVRYPSTANYSDVEKALKKYGNYKILHHQKPLFVDKNSKLIKTLLSIYNKHTNSNKEPIAMGGGTYARVLEKGVAFGPTKNGESCCHKPNEYMSLSDYKECYEIYLDAIKKLCN